MAWRTVLFVAFIFLIGCSEQDPTVVVEESSTPMQEKSSKEEKVNEDVSYYFSGEIHVGNSFVRIISKSNLLKDTVLTLMVDNKEVATAKVEENGEIYTAFPRSNDLVDKHAVFIAMRPELQPKKLQQVYGKTGERLNGSFVYNYTYDNKKYKGLKAGTPIEVLGGTTAAIQRGIISHVGISNPKTLPEE